MRRIILSCALALVIGIPALSQSYPAMAAQEPNQDSLQMTCNGSIGVNDVDYTVNFTREAGFSQINFRRRSSGQAIANTTLSFDRQNDKGQAIWRGAVNDAADVTLVHLSNQPAQRGDQVSVNYDGQWGRGTCSKSILRQSRRL